MDFSLDSCGRRPYYLLLIHLFVLRAAANLACSKPQGGANTVLTNQALLMNDFPEGSVASVECANGYTAESGSGTMTCTSANWTEHSLVCKKKDCGLPKPQPNMAFNVSGGTLFGAVIRVHCDKGYEISGSSYKQCFSTGWGGRAKCEIVTCEKPTKVANGRTLWDSQDDPTYGQTIQFQCDEGFALSGAGTVFCSETGEYDPRPPECKNVTPEGLFMISVSTPAPPPQDLTATTHRGQTITTASPSTQGGRGVFTADVKAATISVTSTASSSQDMNGGAVNTRKDNGYVPVIISAVCVSVVMLIMVYFLYKFLLRRKGSANGTAPIC